MQPQCRLNRLLLQTLQKYQTMKPAPENLSIINQSALLKTYRQQCKDTNWLLQRNWVGYAETMVLSRDYADVADVSRF
jgi:gluconate kinase